MKKDLPPYISYPIFLCVAGVGFMQVPVLAFFSIIFMPLIMGYDFLIPGNFTGEYSNGETVHIVTSAASIKLVTWQAYVFYCSFYLITGFILGLLKHLWTHRKRLA